MPETVDLLYAIGLPPEKAIEYFKRKGYKFSWDWWDTWQEAHAKAFTVAKAMRMDILMDIREMVEKALKEGLTVQQFRKELEPRLKAKGWWGKVMVVDEQGARQVQLGSPWRLKTIYRTNMQTAFMAGRYKAMMENVDNRPYWQYVAVLDSRTRPAHKILHGKVFRYDDPFWKTHYPPLGFNCRCRVRALSQKDMDRENLPKPPDPEDTAKRITWEDALVSKRTGELRPVAVYRDPLTGEKIPTDVGWSYNPGEASWFPDVWRWSPDWRKVYFKNHPHFLHVRDKELRDFLQAEVESCNEEARIIIEKFKYSCTYIKEKRANVGFYVKGKIHISTKHNMEGVFIHEMGHHIDDIFKLSVSDEFSKAFWGSTFVREVPALNPQGQYYSDPHVSGFFEALTKGRIKGKYYHPNYKTYFRSPAMQLAEAFACLFGLYARKDKRALKFVHSYCPKVVEAFIKIMEKLLKA